MSAFSPSSNFSSTLDTYCIFSRPISTIYITFNIANILLLLPPCIFILYHGLQQWRQKPSVSSAATMSHSDCFTYHTAAMELVGILGSVLVCCAIFREDLNIFLVGIFPFYFKWCGETLFHLLTCMEHYLAVVHPITYLSLRRERGIRIRNVIIGCVWLLSVVVMSFMALKNFYIVEFCITGFVLIGVNFCSLSVLCVLIRPGPGEKQGGNRERVNQSKQRAFYTIVAILGVLVLRFSVDLTWSVLHAYGHTDCALLSCEYWLCLPSSLVLPLLFLHRQRKLVSA